MYTFQSYMMNKYLIFSHYPPEGSAQQQVSLASLILHSLQQSADSATSQCTSSNVAGRTCQNWTMTKASLVPRPHPSPLNLCTERCGLGMRVKLYVTWHIEPVNLQLFLLRSWL